MIGEWTPPEGSEITGPPRSNPIVGHIVQRLFDIVHPPSVSQTIYMRNQQKVAIFKLNIKLKSKYSDSGNV